VGYVQGMNLLVALLLIVGIDVELAFWCLVALVEQTLPPSYFDVQLLGLRVEQAVFGDLVRSRMPRLASHLLAHGIVTELYATRWFVGLFSGNLPTETMLRVWDVLVVKGIEVLHRVGLGLLKLSEARLLECADQSDLLYCLQEDVCHCLDYERLLEVAFGARLRSIKAASLERMRFARLCTVDPNSTTHSNERLSKPKARLPFLPRFADGGDVLQRAKHIQKSARGFKHGVDREDATDHTETFVLFDDAAVLLDDGTRDEPLEPTKKRQLLQRSLLQLQLCVFARNPGQPSSPGQGRAQRDRVPGDAPPQHVHVFDL